MKNPRAIAIRQNSLLAPQLDYILLDGSGSMLSKWWDTLAALNNFLTTLQAGNTHSHGILHTFDTRDLECIQRDSTLATWPSLIDPETAPGLFGGGTPLYDAINLMGRRLAELSPPRCSIVIVTDGDETSSKATTADQAAGILNWLRAKGYQITFLGAEFNNSKQAKLLGVDASNSIGVQRTKLLEAGTALGKKRLDNIRSGKPINFSSEEKTDFGGYLTKQ